MSFLGRFKNENEEEKEENNLMDINYFEEDENEEDKGEDEMSTDKLEQRVDNLTENINKLVGIMSEQRSTNPYEQEIMDAVLKKAQEQALDVTLEDVKEDIDKYIKNTYGTLPTKVDLHVPGKEPKEIQGIFHEKFNDILQLVQLNIPILLEGGAGSGKNHVLEQVADALDMDFYFSNAITQEYKITGFIDANGKFHETQFYKAFTEGGIFFLDEIDASIPEVLLILNSAIANKYFDFPIGRVNAHEDFRVVSAGNTSGTGADHIYVGRQQLDGATIDRFARIKFDYDENVERQLASNDEIVDFIHVLREQVEDKSLSYVFSMRAIINATKLDGVMDDEFVVESIVFKSVPKDEIEQFLDYLPSNNRYTKATRNILNKAEEEDYEEYEEYEEYEDYNPSEDGEGNIDEFMRGLGLR